MESPRELSLPFGVWVTFGVLAVAMASVVLVLKRRPWYFGFYWIVPAVGVSLLSVSPDFRIFDLDKRGTQILLAVGLHLLAIGCLFFMRKADLSEEEQKANMARADRVLVTALLVRGKKSRESEAARYIENSELSAEEKKKALEMLAKDQNIRFEEIRERLLREAGKEDPRKT